MLWKVVKEMNAQGKLGCLLLFLCFNGLYAAEFNVVSYGAKGDGKTDDSKAFADAWNAACASTDKTVKLIVPKTTYLLGHLSFKGPCKAESIIFQVEGHLKATTDLEHFANFDVWMEFWAINRLTLTGGGIIDGQGASSWPHNECPRKSNCKLLPVNLKFVGMNNTIVRGIKSVDSKFFHIGIVGCDKFEASDLRIVAPGDSPNTDGIHIERSSRVTIHSSTIGTGDDCISIGHSNSDLLISGVTCGPGHGISVGSLGKYENEGDVNGLVVRDSTFTGTTNGVRIKTWSNSPASTAASNMTFKNLVMKDVENPIIIDQSYCPFAACEEKAPSRVKISDIYFQNIRGTTPSKIAVALKCSKGFPCQNVHLEDVNLSMPTGHQVTSTCENVDTKYSGIQMPPPCA